VAGPLFRRSDSRPACPRRGFVVSGLPRVVGPFLWAWLQGARLMESRPVIGSVDRVDPPWVLAEVDGGERRDLAVEHDREMLERVVRVSDKMRLVW
jgi:hypothetical protein